MILLQRTVVGLWGFAQQLMPRKRLSCTKIYVVFMAGACSRRLHCKIPAAEWPTGTATLASLSMADKDVARVAKVTGHHAGLMLASLTPSFPKP